MLKPFENRDVVQAAVKITNAGDGLSDALGVAPVEYEVGETVHVVLETTCAGVAYVPIKETELMRRVHTLRASDGTIVAAGVVADVLEAHRRAVDEARGTPQLELVDEGAGE